MWEEYLTEYFDQVLDRSTFSQCSVQYSCTGCRLHHFHPTIPQLTAQIEGLYWTLLDFTVGLLDGRLSLHRRYMHSHLIFVRSKVPHMASFHHPLWLLCYICTRVLHPLVVKSSNCAMCGPSILNYAISPILPFSHSLTPLLVDCM